MERHPNAATSPLPTPQADGWWCGRRLRVIYTPPAAPLSHRKETRGREALFPLFLLTASIATKQRDMGAHTDPEPHRLPLAQWSSP